MPDQDAQEALVQDPLVTLGRGRKALAFLLHDKEYAVDIDQAKEVLDVPSMTKIPLMPDFVKGAAVELPSPASSYQLYQLDATPLIDQKLQQLQAAATHFSVTYPITFENGLALAGYEIQPPGSFELPGGLSINTYWRVTDRLQPPVTVFVHLLDQDGHIVAQDDSFGAAARMLEPGDLIVQRHPLKSEAPLPPGTYQIAIGLYNPDTSTRFKTQTGEDRLLLGTVEIKP